MARLRIKIEVNRGRQGAPFRKLSLVYQNMAKFLELAASDLDIKLDELRASHFENGSVICLATADSNADAERVREYDRQLKKLISFKPSKQSWDGKFRTRTLHQYSKIGEHLDPDEMIGMGFFASNDSEIPEWENITKSQTKEVANSISQIRTYHGAIFGKISALYKESKDPHLQIVEVMTGKKINCYYKPSDYDRVIDLLKQKDAFIHVSGIIRANLFTEELEQIDAEDFLVGSAFSEEKYSQLFGAEPNYTGDLSTEEFIKRLRDDNE